MVNRDLPVDSSMNALPPERRIALKLTSPSLRPALRALLMLDARLGEIVSRAREPLLGQIRLAWWRERLADSTSSPSSGDPLMASITADWPGQASDLAPLADAWEELLGNAPLADAAIHRFATGRGAAFAALARFACKGASAAAGQAGERWALADFGFRTSSAQERASAIRLARGLPPTRHLPRSLRGIAVLDGLAARSVAREEPLLAGRGGALAALRLGIFGR